MADMGFGELALLSEITGGGEAAAGAAEAGTALSAADPVALTTRSLAGAGALGDAGFGTNTLLNSLPAESLGAAPIGTNLGGALPSLTMDPSALTSGLNALSPLDASAPSFFDNPLKWWGSLNPKEKLLYGGSAGLAALMARDSRRYGVPGQTPYSGPLSRFRYDPSIYRPSTPFAEGGIAGLGKQDMMVGGGPPRTPPLGSPSDNFDWQQRSDPATYMASGGISDLGSYSDGGRMLRGPGDGMSDSIPAMIADRRPARLAEGEFVVPADVVSHLGNGSTDAGAKQLYSMMDRVRSARTGTKKQGREIKPTKFMPA